VQRHPAPVTAPLLDLDDYVVGRQPELTLLDGALARAERHGGECVLVSGVPGVGKSTLLQAFSRRVVARDGLFAYGRCQEGARAPYAAVGEALRALARGMESTPAGERDRWPADLVHALAAIAGTLGTLVPELNPILGPAPEAVDLTVLDLTAADSRRRLQRAATRLIAVTAAYRPVVLAVDACSGPTATRWCCCRRCSRRRSGTWCCWPRIGPTGSTRTCSTRFDERADGRAAAAVRRRSRGTARAGVRADRRAG